MPILNRYHWNPEEARKELTVLDEIRRDIGYDLIGKQISERIERLHGIDVYFPDTSNDSFSNKMKCTIKMSHDYVAVHQGTKGAGSNMNIFTDYECSRCSSHLRVHH